MTWADRLSAFCRPLGRWAAASTWAGLASLFVIAAWGVIDPFGVRQRLDWMVTDQLLAQRRPAPLHPDIVQISIDDRAADLLGISAPRYLYARALQQLNALGAKTVLFDILLLDQDNELALDEAERLLIPRSSVVQIPELADAFTSDRLLADSMSELNLVIPFFVPETLRGQPADAALREAMTERLTAEPGLSPERLASELRADSGQVQRLFESALRGALERLAARSLDAASAETTSNELLGSALGTGRDAANLGQRFFRALDRVQAGRILRDKAIVASERSPRRIERLASHDEPQPPIALLSFSADYLGFADELRDADGRTRRLPLIKGWQDGVLLHQALVAAIAHHGVAPGDVEIRRDAVRLGSETLATMDRQGNMFVNWPFSRRRPWDVALPQLSLADLLALDDWQFNIRVTRHRLREKVAILDQLSESGLGWAAQFENILTAYAEGRREDALRLEEKFDERAVPQVLALQPVQAAMEEASQSASMHEVPADMLQLARDVLEIQQQLPELTRGYSSAFDQLKERVVGKLCLVGDTRTGSSDLKQTPVGSGVPGVSVMAAATNSMLSGDHLRVLGFGSSVLAMLLIAGGLSVPAARLKPVPAATSALVALACTFLASYLLLAIANTILSPVAPVIGLVAVYVVHTTYQWLYEYRQRKLVRAIFEAQTNPTIVERLLEAGEKGVEEVLDPKQRQITIFFAEIANFPSLTEQVAAERLPEILSRTFGTMAKIILANEGTLDRYQGHAMVAFFGAPIYQPDHAQRACRAALECCDALQALEPQWIERQIPVPIVHVGLHTGELLVGNITLTTRVDYTVAGENLNIAYRIGELNETFGTQIMLSEATLHRAEGAIEARELDMVRIKGRREPLRAYELMSATGRLSREQLDLRGTFTTGLVAFRNRDYANALAMFQSCRNTAPGDRPATIYIERCQRELGQTAGATESSEKAPAT